MSDRQRLFLALNPSDDDQKKLYALARDIVATTGGRIVPRHNLHLTLRFFGAVDAQQRNCIQAIADTVQARPFQLEFGALISTRNMVWIAPANSPPLLSLVEELRVLDAECDVPGAEHHFSAHITLIRNAKRIPAELPKIPEPVCCRFSEFYLMRSQTLPEGSQYSEVASWPLK
jgi:2'-5' RNA ligase